MNDKEKLQNISVLLDEWQHTLYELYFKAARVESVIMNLRTQINTQAEILQRMLEKKKN